jgi:hypothetical protein
VSPIMIVSSAESRSSLPAGRIITGLGLANPERLGAGGRFKECNDCVQPGAIWQPSRYVISVRKPTSGCWQVPDSHGS